jgi:hypothetical protein
VHLDGVPVDAERVIRTKVAVVAVLWNAVAVVVAALLPVAVLGLPVMRAMFLPDSPVFAFVPVLPLPSTLQNGRQKRQLALTKLALSDSSSD